MESGIAQIFTNSVNPDKTACMFWIGLAVLQLSKYFGNYNSTLTTIQLCRHRSEAALKKWQILVNMLLPNQQNHVRANNFVSGITLKTFVLQA